MTTWINIIAFGSSQKTNHSENFPKTCARLTTRLFFPLHVTLLPRIRKDYETVKALAKQLAETLSPLDVRITGKGTKDRCVFLGVESVQLANAAKLARELFESDESYTPHLGVLYADFDEEKMNSIASSLPSVDVSFTITSIHLAKTSRDVREWGVVDEIPFE
ncbi:MAG: 2'-5' RNA ligase family protein [Candidatus Woesearchaeota archaeon]|nr:2'-5' RNA ligase family protein [Candidatus Woesearchaeota archaeon]MDP7198221.1 2'-5' RNA ligase family protein [Candidatus Woesearchaeota archaeon]MDP7467057.1 2'-5' RNA ligase family protein [Candidatus Woesearchaeota archaeon]MDP7646725.1 2'-5' RNA ligase family protein [Candidatus Woesearchaeota archaeon]